LNQSDLWQDYKAPPTKPKSDEKVLVMTFSDTTRGLTVPFDPNLYCEVDANGKPFMSKHSVSQGGELIGSIFRLYPDMPWQYQYRMGDKAKTAKFDFDKALKLLLEWRDKEDAKTELLFNTPGKFKTCWKGAAPTKKKKKK
jgi:hypothetical protein